MNFVSPGFALFLSIVFLLYWFVFKKNTQSQNILLLVASLFFYTWFNWRFSGLLIFSILFNFYIGKLIQTNRERSAGRWLLSAGLMANLGILFCFKYYNFFNTASPVNHPGSTIHPSDIFLPLGISFYTFQALGYIIDVYNEEIKSCNDLLAFSTYVAYFPKIASGPIEPAKKFLPQIVVKRNFDYTLAADGMRQMLGAYSRRLLLLIIVHLSLSLSLKIIKSTREALYCSLLSFTYSRFIVIFQAIRISQLVFQNSLAYSFPGISMLPSFLLRSVSTGKNGI